MSDLLQSPPALPSKQAIDQCFADYDFERVNSPLIAPHDFIAWEVRRLGPLFENISAESETNLGSQLETFCAQLEHIELRRFDAGLVSYADIAPQADIFGCLISLFRIEGYLPPTQSLGDFLESWSDALPKSRLYLYLLAEHQLEQGEPAEALKSINAALNINNVCIGSQRMLEKIARAHPNLEHLPAHLSDTTEYLKDRFCGMPFTFLSTGWQGDSFACACPAWMPYKVGNIATAESDAALWNSPEVQELRTSILDGSFRYCSRTLCEYINSRKLPLRSEVSDPTLAEYIRENNPVAKPKIDLLELNHENSCNLACPSCRPEIRISKPSEIDHYNKAISRTILPLLRNVSTYTYISGGGEAFASRHYREILKRLNKKDFPNLKIFLISNGLLINQRLWEEFKNLHGMFRLIAISIDAATKETYERVRRPGKWENLLKSMVFLADLRANNHIPQLWINFVVQQENFREIPAFIELGNQWGVDGFWLQRMTNYGSFTATEFQNKDVCHPDHPDHPEFLDMLRQPFFQDSRINAGMLQSCIPDVRLPDRDIHEMLFSTGKRETES
ncbi:MAG: radical SAM protein [Chthoniobacterales bacterium]